MEPVIQNYFVQVTIQKGRLLQKDDGSIEKVVDETLKDDLIPFDNASDSDNLSQKLKLNGNLDFEEVQKEINLKK